MSSVVDTNNLRGFHEFLKAKLTNGGAESSPEEALDEWRRMHPDPETQANETAAIKEALDDLANGDAGILFEQFDREFRARHRLPAKP